MPHPNVLVVVVDGLRASALGAYGNTTYPTSALDAFAAESLLLDWCYAPTTDLRGIYAALWQSLHPAQRDVNGAHSLACTFPSQLLPTQFAEAGYQTTIVTDEPQLQLFDGAEAFHNHVQVKQAAAGDESQCHAQTEFETELAHVFAAASELVEGHLSKSNAAADAHPKLIWLHARGMYSAWDAPLEFQESLRDESDPLPVESVEPPDFVAAAKNDPDVVFRYASAYAAQTMAFDACWQRLLDGIDVSASGERWLVMLIGARGFPLGEHGRFGGVDPRLYAEQLHVPWLIRFPDGRGQLARDDRLVSHLDVFPTLIDGIAQLEAAHFDGQSVSPRTDNSTPHTRETLLSISDHHCYAVRSASWCLRESANPNTEPAADAEYSELYVRPDDRWEANDVSKLCPNIVESLRTTAIEMRQHYAGEADTASGNNP